MISLLNSDEVQSPRSVGRNVNVPGVSETNVFNGIASHQGQTTADIDARSRAESRQVAEDQFRGSNAVFYLMVNNIADYAIIMLDPSGAVVTWNPGAQAISGYQAEEAIGKSYSIFFSAIAIQEGKPKQELAEAAATGPR